MSERLYTNSVGAYEIETIKLGSFFRTYVRRGGDEIWRSHNITEALDARWSHDKAVQRVRELM